MSTDEIIGVSSSKSLSSKPGSTSNKTDVTLQGMVQAPLRIPWGCPRRTMSFPVWCRDGQSDLSFLPDSCVPCSPCPQLCKRGQPLPKYLRGCLEDLGVRNKALPITPHSMGGTSSMGHPGSALYPQSSPVSDERGLGVRLNPATDLGQGKAGGGLFLLVFVFRFSVQCHMLHYDINRKSKVRWKNAEMADFPSSLWIQLV